MKRAGWAILVALCCRAVYLAAVTPVSTAEAVTYNKYVSQPVLTIVSAPYDPANQVLNSLLSHLVLRVFHVNDFTFRIATLFGILLYLLAAIAFLSPQSNPWVGGVIGLAVCIPLTLTGWLPQATGFWMAAGLSLVALRHLVHFGGNTQRLALASLLLGFAVCFFISFCLVAVAAVMVFLHFNFRSALRISFSTAVNHLILPGGFIVFSLWALPLVNASFDRFTVSKLLPLPNRVIKEPAPNLARVARELRDEIRKHPPRPIRVAVLPELAERVDFYRRRYALGAVQRIAPAGSSVNADYTIELDPQTGLAKLKATTLVENHH